MLTLLHVHDRPAGSPAGRARSGACRARQASKALAAPTAATPLLVARRGRAHSARARRGRAHSAARLCPAAATADRGDAVVPIPIKPDLVSVRQLERGRCGLAINQEQEAGPAGLEQKGDQVPALQTRHEADEECKTAVLFCDRVGLVEELFDCANSVTALL